HIFPEAFFFNINKPTFYLATILRPEKIFRQQLFGNFAIRVGRALKLECHANHFIRTTNLENFLLFSFLRTNSKHSADRECAVKGFKEIRQRIRAIGNTAEITRAMQLVASSKMKHAQRSAVDGRRYSLRLSELANCIIGHVEDISLPLFQRRDIGSRGILLVGTSKGLCGSFNQNLFRIAAPLAAQSKFIAVGKKSAAFVASMGWQLLAEFPLNDNVPFHEVRSIANFARDAYLGGTIDSVEVASTLYVNTLIQKPTLQTLLPFDFIEKNIAIQRELLGENSETFPDDERELIIEPAIAPMVQSLGESFFRETLYHLLLESKAAEQCARMVAMKTATDNAESLVKELNREYNKIRQAFITNEITEISSGSVAR
ncbi:MAG: ATP synthase F1 subunit gamma, partial [Puniceicoccales bacterium]|nr:ATP synthase F1 subunit gamma [Puniceicoccales bacterium]